MTRFRAWAALAGLLVGAFPLPGCAKAEAPATVVPEGYKLVWADEFNTPGEPDSRTWSYSTDGNRALWWHNERQYYAARRRQNVRVEDGHLVIQAHKEQLSKFSDWVGQEYTSGKIVTAGRQSWKYGFFDIRAKLPCGRGTWPAIWLMSETGGWPYDGEIDIMEFLGFGPNYVHASLHHSKGMDHQGTVVDDTCGTFHSYQLDWRPDSMTFLVDNRPFGTVRKGDRTYASWPFDHKFYLILNLAIGGSWGAQQGIDPTIFPVQMDIDYVRVYQRGG